MAAMVVMASPGASPAGNASMPASTVPRSRHPRSTRTAPTWCESSGKCQYASIYCPQEPTPKVDKDCTNLGGALQTWCPSKNACTKRSACPEKPCMGMDSHGCNGCDGESWCEATGTCQYGSIYCPPAEDKACLSVGGALQTWCPSKNSCTARSAC